MFIRIRTLATAFMLTLATLMSAAALAPAASADSRPVGTWRTYGVSYGHGCGQLLEVEADGRGALLRYRHCDLATGRDIGASAQTYRAPRKHGCGRLLQVQVNDRARLIMFRYVACDRTVRAIR